MKGLMFFLVTHFYTNWNTAKVDIKDLYPVIQKLISDR